VALQSVSLELHVDAVPPRVVVGGELETSTAATFTRRLASILRTHPRIVLDIRAVRFLDSAGLRALFVHRDSLMAVLVDETSPPARALALSGLGMVIPLTRGA
jgi:anti-anti-sigma factor